MTSIGRCSVQVFCCCAIPRESENLVTLDLLETKTLDPRLRGDDEYRQVFCCCVIPAKAGIQRLLDTLETKTLDPRLRGDDEHWQVFCSGVLLLCHPRESGNPVT